MKNLFDKLVMEEVTRRMEQLHADSTARWGKMNVSQMLAHMRKPFKLALSEKKVPRLFIGRLMGWMFKKKLYDDSVWKPGLPTSPDFIVKDARNFEEEKQKLMAAIKQFYTAGPDGISKHPHPMFGKFTPEQWGKSMYKHLDHHLRQFGA
jgi:alkylated DNA repair dioxygenase AlkB